MVAQDYVCSNGNNQSYIISGKVCINPSNSINCMGGTPLSGVTLYGAGLTPSPFTTSANGLYSYAVPASWPGGLVTPTKAGCVFSPPSNNYGQLTSNQLNQDYIALCADKPLHLTGHVYNLSLPLTHALTITATGIGLFMGINYSGVVSPVYGTYRIDIPIGWTGTLSYNVADSAYSLTPTPSLTFSSPVLTNEVQDWQGDELIDVISTGDMR